ncbi:MAG: hypothetical protein M3Q99_17530 [Acidobacteriota bacterium]|nr:hypothetical protein [Acidobacteriota bacterium]
MFSFDNAKSLISTSGVICSARKLLLLLLVFLAISEQYVSPAQTRGDNTGGINLKEIKPVTVYKQNQLADISGDGKLLLFYQTRVPMRTYTIPLDGSPGYANQPPVHDDVFRVVERESGREVARLGIQDPSTTRFTPGTKKIIYKERTKARPFGNESKIWDYQTGETKLCLNIKKSVYSPAFVDSNTAFGTVDDENKYLGSILTKIDLTNCQTEVIGRIYPLDPNNRVRNNTIRGSGIKISPDGKLMAYSLDSNDKIIFRNTAKPEQIVREIDSAPLYFWSEQRFTPDGKFLITNAADGYMAYGGGVQENYYLLIYDMKSFRKVGQIVVPVNGQTTIPATAQIAVSPDSRLVAATYKTVKKGTWDNTEQAHVAIYDIASGKQVGKVSHPPLKEKRSDPFRSNISTIIFTPDGKHLLTSISDTYVWDVSNL